MSSENHFSYSWKNILKCRNIGIKLIERKFKDERILDFGLILGSMEIL